MSPARRWLADCIKGGKGEPLPILANALAALRSDSVLHNIVAQDEMLRAPILMRPLGGGNTPFTPRPVTDADVTKIQEYLQHAGLARITRKTPPTRPSTCAPSNADFTRCVTTSAHCRGMAPPGSQAGFRNT